MIRKKANPFYAIDDAFAVLYIYTWRIIDHLHAHANVHVKIFMTINYEMKSKQLIMHR